MELMTAGFLVVAMLLLLAGGVWIGLALMAVGAAVGSRLDRLRELVEQYTMIVWIVLAVVAAAMATRWYARRRRDRARTDDPGPE